MIPFLFISPHVNHPMYHVITYRPIVESTLHFQLLFNKATKTIYCIWLITVCSALVCPSQSLSQSEKQRYFHPRRGQGGGLCCCWCCLRAEAKRTAAASWLSHSARRRPRQRCVLGVAELWVLCLVQLLAANWGLYYRERCCVWTACLVRTVSHRLDLPSVILSR